MYAGICDGIDLSQSLLLSTQTSALTASFLSHLVAASWPLKLRLRQRQSGQSPENYSYDSLGLPKLQKSKRVCGCVHTYLSVCLCTHTNAHAVGHAQDNMETVSHIHKREGKICYFLYS